jgi:hypothetical protein
LQKNDSRLMSLSDRFSWIAKGICNIPGFGLFKSEPENVFNKCPTCIIDRKRAVLLTLGSDLLAS